ncbi:MAG: glycosyltransferase [Anaerolineaceae bacterium]|jgi:glycosyltransferase involved in cell wall biosynthesis
MIEPIKKQRGLTFVIATYNASWLIEETLKHLMKMHIVPQLSWEVLLIDNNSTDDTIERAKQIWQSDAELRIIREEQQGTGYAKFRGMQEAKYEYIGVVDQDNWVDEDWMLKAVEYLDIAPRAACVFGKGTPVFESTPPEWFERYQQNFAVGSQHQTNGGVNDEDCFFYAAGSILRKKAFDQLKSFGFKPILHSRAGSNLLSGEDTELQILLRLIGWELYYEEDLQFKHYMPAQRLTRQYFKKFRRGLGATSVYLNIYRNYRKQRRNLRYEHYGTWQSLMWKSIRRALGDPLAIAASFLPHYTANYRVAKFWSHEGEFMERLRIGSELQKTQESLYKWLDTITSSSIAKNS